MALYRSPDYQLSFESTDLSVQEKIFNIDFQDGGVPIRMSLATFNLIVTSILPMKFRVNSFLVQDKKKFKIDFQHGC